MVQRLRNRAQGQEGFTLIELLVVVLIIGILAAVAIPVFLNQTSKANAANVKSDINSAATAEETYFTDNQTYIVAANTTATAITTINPALVNSFTAASTSSGEGMTITAPTAVNGSTVSGTIANGYTITAYDASTGSSGVAYYFTKNSDGSVARACKVPAQVNPGGCKAVAGATALTTSSAIQYGTW